MRPGIFVLAGCLAGCGAPGTTTKAELASRSPSPDGDRVEQSGVAGPAAATKPTQQSAAEQSAGTGEQPVVLVTDAAVLAALEHEGLGAGPIAFGRGGDTLESFADAPRMKDFRRALERDVAQQQAADPRAGVGMRHSHRLFDVSWLTSPKTRFELVGVANRLDRQPFVRDEADSGVRCGETRLVYRLAYRTVLHGEEVDSRLPMTLNVVFWQDDTSCEAAANRWMAPADLEGEALASWLRRAEGPLAPARLSSEHLESVEVNVQVIRWPAVVHPSLGGHAAYVLRVFEPHGSGLRAAPLENTPDVSRLRKDGGARKALLAWLRDEDHREALEQGVAVMPEEFAATRAISVTPRGMGRRANRPFSELYSASDFEDLGFEGGTHVKSAQALLRRLDGLSCQGCHEIRSVAGFHLLGEPREPDAVLDTLALPTSPHLDGDLSRRAAWVRAAAAGAKPTLARPLSDFERNAGGYGSHCGLGDAGFASWTCAQGLKCVEMDDPQMGTCLPAQGRGAGDPCETGSMRSRPDPVDDRVRGVEVLGCDDDAVCNRSAVGFPAGMCTKSCGGLGPDEACGTIVDLRSFNDCLVQRNSFATCVKRAGGAAGMRRCGAEHRCRDDYICARSPSDPGQGVCLPPYFLFQMRVDGHVL